MSNSVSIIVPTRNRSGVLARCLAALPAGIAGCDLREVIVVDDCSTDGTLDVVNEFRRSTGWQVQCIRQEEPKGANTARNMAVRSASGDIIVLIDDDVLVTEGWLAKLLSGLSSESPVVSGPVRLTIDGPLLGKHREEVSAYLAEVLSVPRGDNGEVVPVFGNMAAYKWVFKQAAFDGCVRPPCEEVDWLRRAGVAAAFALEGLVWHYKTPEEIQLKRMLRLAWLRGSEGGWWVRERLNAPRQQRMRMASRSLHTSFRSIGHAARCLCWGGVVVGIGELAKALALVGLINRGPRVAESWR